MGRRVEHNRRISNDRVRKARKQKSKILIAAEGKNKTEKTYFSNFEDGKKSYNITYVRGNNTDPLKLVKMLIKEIDELKLDLQDDDVAYCIFDTDVDPNKNKIIDDLKKEIRENSKIKICASIFSMYGYEVLKKELSNINEFKFIFSDPTFIEKNDKKEQRLFEINYRNVGSSGKNTIEFRLPNGTINPTTWVENINLFGGLIRTSHELSKIMKKTEEQRTEEEKQMLYN